MKKNHKNDASVKRSKLFLAVLTMKLTLVFTVLFFVSASASTYSQSTKLDLLVQNSFVTDILTEIENTSEFVFIYESGTINEDMVRSLDIKNKKIDKILDKLFADTDIEYQINDKQIVLYANNSIESMSMRPAELLSAGQQETKTITGNITDQNGGSLPGVSIVVRGTTIGTVTDINGDYTLDVPTDAEILVFSFVGMAAQEIAIGNQAQIDVVLESDFYDLDVVVVTGYSSERKKDIIGSVAIADVEEMQKTPTIDAAAMLQGRVAGVSVTTDGSGEATKVRIRGFSSFTSNEPLYIIDGIPGSMDNLNPNDIESTQVLKDAASASIYGSRAANGVIIITTKKGQKNTSTLSFDGYVGVQNFTDLPDMMNSMEYGEYIFELQRGAGFSVGDPNWGNAVYGYGATPQIPDYLFIGGRQDLNATAIQELKTSDPTTYAAITNPDNYDYITNQIVPSAKGEGTNWFDEVYNPALIQNYNLSASGGGNNGTYAMSVNYSDRESATNPWGSAQRYSFRVNSTMEITDWLTVGENVQLNYNYSKAGGAGSGSGTAWTFNSIIPVYDITGVNYAGSAVEGVVDVGDRGSNPLWSYWTRRYNWDASSGYNGNVFAELTPIEGLTVRSVFGFNSSGGAGHSIDLITWGNYEGNGQAHNSISGDANHRRGWTFQNTATYAKSIAEHDFNLMVGSEATSSWRYSIDGQKEDLLVPTDPNYQLINTASGTQSVGGSWSRGATYALFTKLSYTYADKYLLNATVRRDGDPAFGQNNRYGVFPSAALGWRISSENFMSGIDWIDDLKIRASYGITGNSGGLNIDQIYATYESSISQSYSINGSTISESYTQESAANQDVRWEEQHAQNYGFDATIFDGAWTINADYYVQETKDLLVTRLIPSTALDVDQPYENVGNIRNSGIELMVANRGDIGDLKYDLSLNFTHYKNKVVKYLDNPESYTSSSIGRMSDECVRTQAGYEISTFWGYTLDGFFESDAEVAKYLADGYTNDYVQPRLGGWRYKDISGPDGEPDLVIDEYDRGNLGSPHPDFTVGFNLGLEYKNFDLSAFAYWNQGGEIFNGSLFATDFNTFSWNRRTAAFTESWTEATKGTATLPKLNINDTQSYQYSSSYFIEDASYLRLRTLQLGYNFPKSILNRIGASRLRIYIQAENLITWKSKESRVLDPGGALSGGDTGMGRVTENQNPTAQQFLFGINFGL